MAHRWKPERCWITLHPHHLYPSSWSKVFLYLVSINTYEYLALVACHKGPLSSQFPTSKFHPLDPIGVTAVVVPRVTCGLPLTPVPFQLNWKHLADLPLADPGFGQPSRIDMLLGVDVFVDVLCHGRRSGPPDSPTALETEFGAMR